MKGTFSKPLSPSFYRWAGGREGMKGTEVPFRKNIFPSPFYKGRGIKGEEFTSSDSFRIKTFFVWSGRPYNFYNVRSSTWERSSTWLNRTLSIGKSSIPAKAGTRNGCPETNRLAIANRTANESLQIREYFKTISTRKTSSPPKPPAGCTVWAQTRLLSASWCETI